MDPRSDVASAQSGKDVEEQSRRATDQQGGEAFDPQVPRGKRGRGSSRDVLRDLKAHMAKMEIALGDVRVVEEVSESIEIVETGKDELHAEVQELRSGMEELQ